ncbi:hypothetical protein N5915_04565 [Arcobacter lacus]|uniref:hypothetical protein n=1 Tax=Arcobacter lacus TaxID=1912876 RepID=UPI0021BB5126|nr:hypothetical protein [Arcobacter lacus]MCT7908824.1 hypothetical protein [Arcobacter lacus]MCT7911160.1 hypothetical protein [Arcobacter lacus]
MIIEIKDEFLTRLINFMENENLALYNELKEIKPLDSSSLEKARKIKTQRVKDLIKKTLQELINENISPTKYQIHKRTKIAYTTINKYFDEILIEVQKR